MKKNRSNLSRLFDYAGKFKYLTIASQCLSAISALMALIPFIYIWMIVNEAIVTYPNYSNSDVMRQYGWLAVMWAVSSMIVYVLGLICSHLSAFRIASNIRIRTMHHIATLPVGFMDRFGSGKLRKIVNESSAATETYLAHQLPDLAGSLATPLGLLFLMLYFDWRLGVLCLIPVLLAFFVISYFMLGSKLKEDMQKYQTSLDEMTNEAVEYVRGIPVLKTFGQSVLSLKRFKAAIDDYGFFTISYTRKLRKPMMVFTALINSVFAMLIAGSFYLLDASNSQSDLTNLIFYIIITPIISVTMMKVIYSSEEKMIVENSLDKIDLVMTAKPLSQTDKPEKPKDNSILLDKVSFRYEGAAKDALHQISLSINAGEHVAFVGPSGGGKTTLASVISRFWDVTEGKVCIGGVNIRHISAEELTRTISFVFQDSKLIKGTLLENLLMAKPNASREEIAQALHDAQCDDIIAKMPQGINTYIGTGGVYLSGGEQQRISIARVMLRNTPIIILDEATAFADPDNELKVQKAFSVLSKGKTVIMIAHRLSTITNVDRIFVLKEGEIVQEGNHSTLLAQDCMYAQMWSDYNHSVQWKINK